MSLHRRAAKRDENEPTLVDTLEAHGCVVWRLSGKGLPDLLVMRKGRKWLADVKMPGKPTTKPQEDLWEEAATKARCAVFILRTPEDAVAMLNDALPPWEPSLRHPCTVEGKLKPASNPTPRKGGSAKARAKGRHALKVYQHCAVEGCERGEKCGKIGTGGMGHAIRPLAENYTPPRSTTVDAAKEAEAFAPPVDGFHPCAHNGCEMLVKGSDTCMEHDL